MGEKKGFFSRLVEGLTKTRNNIVSGIDSVFHGFSKIDDEFYEELEEILIMGDLGVKATESILDDLREKVKANHVKEPAECKQLLIDSIKQQMQVGETAYRFEEETSVVLVIGVNGVGKTTTVGKLAGKLKEQGKKVVIAGADTFRAYMSNAIGFPCKLNCVLSSYITYESHAFCSGNSYLNAIPSSNALTTRFIRRPESDRSCMGTVISLQRLRTLLVLPTMSLYVSSIFLRCTFPALRFLPNSPLSKLKPSKEFAIRDCFL